MAYVRSTNTPFQTIWQTHDNRSMNRSQRMCVVLPEVAPHDDELALHLSPEYKRDLLIETRKRLHD